MRPATWTSEQPSNPARLTPSTTNEYINKTIRTDDMGTPPCPCVSGERRRWRLFDSVEGTHESSTVTV